MTDFLDLHVPGQPLLIPNAWDIGSARMLEQLGARALATTSSGHAGTLGLSDGEVGREQVLAHCADLAQAVEIPVSADLEDGFAGSLDELAGTFRDAAATGLAGGSIEDFDGTALYAADVATERVEVAREAAPGFVLTARTEGYLRGNPSLSDAISRLQAYADAGADVLYAPGLTDLDEIRSLVSEVPRPVNVLLLPGLEVGALADAGVARISVGGSIAWVGRQAASAAARDFLSGGSGWLGG